MKSLILVLMLVLVGCGDSPLVEGGTECPTCENCIDCENCEEPEVDSDGCPVGSKLDYYVWRDTYEVFKNLNADEYLEIDFYTGSWRIENGSDELIACGAIDDLTDQNIVNATEEQYLVDFTLKKADEETITQWTDCSMVFLFNGYSGSPNVPAGETRLYVSCLPIGLGANELAYNWVSFGF